MTPSRGATPAAWVRRLVMLAILVYLSLWAWTGHRVGKAEESFKQGRFDAAHAILSGASFWHVRSGRVNDALGVVDLARGREAEAAVHLTAARRGFFHPAAFGEERILASFIKEGSLEPARLYGGHRAGIREHPALLFYLGVAENGLNRLDEADKHLATAEAGADAGLRERAAAQRRIITEKRGTGRADFLFDRRGAPLAGLDLKTGVTVPVAAGLAGMVEGAWGPRLEPRDRAGRVRLTLDLEFQRAAEAALGEQRGAFVVLDVRDGAVLALASRPAVIAAPDGPAPPALVKAYEPGSIIKMLTLSAALRNGVSIDQIFPYQCAGWMSIDGVAFRDWMTHRRVESIDEAVAVSCNLAFGKLGQLVGRDLLNAELRRYGLDHRSSQAPPGTADLRYEVGAMLAEDGAHPGFALARRAEGLDSLEITPIGAAILAAGLARGGSPPIVHIIEEKIDVLGETTYRRQTDASPGDPLPAAGAATIARVMKAAVTDPEGTARRAMVEGLPAAMKTGTAGTSPPGYDGWMIGFAPADTPRIAWALVTENAGKAEWEAARITREFLRRVEPALRGGLP